MTDQLRKKARNLKTGPKKTVRIIAAVMGLFLVGFAVLLATRKPVSMQTVASPLINKAAPAISGTSLDGKKVSLGSYSGQFVLVNFFASWCSPCQDEEKALVQFSSSSPSVNVLGVVFDDTNSSAAGFLHRYGANYQAVSDPNGQIALSYGVSQPPQSYLIAPNGVILTEIIGPVSFASLNQLVDIAKSRGF
ncbi:MAG: TlpA family protein disulfide reductase [Actinomycetota bacterium]|nr:MAG: TlpA family protein disulfide reductase [Actinomycetota bacterium]